MRIRVCWERVAVIAGNVLRWLEEAKRYPPTTKSVYPAGSPSREWLALKNGCLYRIASRFKSFGSPQATPGSSWTRLGHLARAREMPALPHTCSSWQGTTRRSPGLERNP